MSSRPPQGNVLAARQGTLQSSQVILAQHVIDRVASSRQTQLLCEGRPERPPATVQRPSVPEQNRLRHADEVSELGMLRVEDRGGPARLLLALGERREGDVV